MAGNTPFSGGGLVILIKIQHTQRNRPFRGMPDATQKEDTSNNPDQEIVTWSSDGWSNIHKDAETMEASG